ncbi:CpsD/CapB family tyrosine-protein kinase [Alkalibacterium sp. f15]|uniref:CpsD/CapB family tyrosine-protein kinase n=1 Tax=Alkalibacterium sp. f15 TaxID=3414029 RepID=UPI003BF78279
MHVIRKKQKNSNRYSNLVVDNNPNSSISEQFRTIRTNLHFSMIDRKFKTIVITSAGQGAGKSFAAINLAATIASENKRVLLVDADLRRPTVNRTFRLNNYLGLTTLLADKDLSASKVIRYNRNTNLYILTSGAIPPNPSELLSSDRMNEIMKELEADFDLIIYDMPPVLAVTDAQILASKVDGTIFVLPKGQVTEEDAMKSKELLDIVGARVIGAIFNRVKKKNNDYYYQSIKEEDNGSY